MNAVNNISNNIINNKIFPHNLRKFLGAMINNSKKY